MSVLNISWEWELADGVRSPEFAATFARLELRAGQDLITLVEDRTSGSSRRAIHVGLYPLAEWIAFNWWVLQAHSRPAREQRSLDSRHSMRSSADGFLWPDVYIVPEGARTRVCWARDRDFTAGANLRYLTQGDVLVDSPELQFTLSGFVTAVIDRLVESDVKDTSLQEEWRSIQAADGEEREFCLAAARLGLDPYAEASEYESQIIIAAAELPSSVLGDFYDAVSPQGITQSLGWVAESLHEVSSSEGQLGQDVLRARDVVRRSSLPQYQAPWTTGWRQAALVRESLGVDPGSAFDMDRFVRSAARPSGERRIQAAGWGGARTANLVVLGHHYARTSRNFTLARAFWHLVAADQSEFLVVSSYTDRQKVERAFAAELLAPAEGIADALGSLLADAQQEELDELAEKYEVSTAVVAHQVHNQLLGVAR